MTPDMAAKVWLLDQLTGMAATIAQLQQALSQAQARIAELEAKPGSDGTSNP